MRLPSGEPGHGRKIHFDAGQAAVSQLNHLLGLAEVRDRELDREGAPGPVQDGVGPQAAQVHLRLDRLAAEHLGCRHVLAHAVQFGHGFGQQQLACRADHLLGQLVQRRLPCRLAGAAADVGEVRRDERALAGDQRAAAARAAAPASEARGHLGDVHQAPVRGQPIRQQRSEVAGGHARILARLAGRRHRAGQTPQRRQSRRSTTWLRPAQRVRGVGLCKHYPLGIGRGGSDHQPEP